MVCLAKSIPVGATSASKENCCALGTVLGISRSAPSSPRRTGFSRRTDPHRHGSAAPVHHAISSVVACLSPDKLHERSYDMHPTGNLAPMSCPPAPPEHGSLRGRFGVAPTYPYANRVRWSKDRRSGWPGSMRQHGSLRLNRRRHLRESRIQERPPRSAVTPKTAKVDK
jgi:hypothetical protein